MMKAVQINKYGGPEVIEVNENVPKPSLKNGQVLVDVCAASINPIDWKLRLGYLKENVPLQFPTTLGGDFAGIVQEIGENVTDFKRGDQVYGQAGILNGGSGSIAEFAAAAVGKISAKPKSTSYEEAAALPLAGASAFQALKDHIKLQKGQKILIHGGAGGIGSYAIQIAKALSAYVATTVSPDDRNFAESLGADEVIDYKSQNFEELLGNYDAVFDTVGDKTWEKSFKILKKGGIIVSMVGQPDPELAQKYGVISVGQRTDATPNLLKRLIELVETGKVKVNVDKVFTIDQARDAFEYQEKQSPKGKVVLKIKK